MEPAENRLSQLFTVVIASVCDEARSDRLRRACESVERMAGNLDHSIIVIANGPRVCPKVIAWLRVWPNVHVIRLRTGFYPLARRVGAEVAESEFLAFLDDDDELMPDTLDAKIEYFRANPEVDVLVTDGIRVNGASEKRIFPAPEARTSDFVETMMRAGWVAGALTLRAKNIDLSAFDPQFRHLEWTATTLELARRHKVGFLDIPAYRYHQDTPGSLSKSLEYATAPPELWLRLAKSYSGTRYQQTVRRRYGLECHHASWEYMHQGKLLEAWRLHAESLGAPGGVSFLPFTFALLFASVRRLRR